MRSQQEMAELAMTEAQLRIVRSKLREWRKVQRRLERRARILRRVLGETRVVH
ncbi:MAG TPA: hypothetical protein VEZ44_12050 [bacterium]|nr:hypothetical protein [bacterium]